MASSATLKQAEMADSRPRSRRVYSRIIAGAVGAAFLCAGFTALYWNRFLSPSSGSTFLYVAEQVLKGRLPYRDFLFLIPPLQVWKTAALIRLFGDQLIVPRLEGAVERIITAVLLYLWLTRLCRPASAMFSTFLAMVLFASDVADSIESYHHSAVMWAVAAGLCSSFCLGPGSGLRQNLAAFASGMFCAFSLLTKQTVGAGVLLAIPMVLGLYHWKSSEKRRAVSIVLSLFCGALIPVLVFFGWLWRTGSFAPFVHTVFSATTSKGTPVAVLTRPFLQFPWLFFPVAIITPLFASLVLRMPQRQRRLAGAAFGLTAIAVSALGFSVLLVFAGAWHGALFFLTQRAEFAVLTLCITGSACIFFHHAIRLFRNGLQGAAGQVWLMSAVSLATAYMLSLSWALYGPMAVPALGLICGLTLDRMERSDRKVFWIHSSLLGVLICVSAAARLTVPFAWRNWPEGSIKDAAYSSTLPKLAGLRISEPTLSLTERITAVVKSHTGPGDSLVVYPYYPLFYSVTGLNPPTYTFNYFIDVCPDPVCRQDAARILQARPKAIICVIEGEERVLADEAIYRSGAKSGSREVVRAINQLKLSYQKLLSSPVPGSGETIEVYIRPESDGKGR